ncbi:hypothetical protein CEXT_563631 [Caerostris extrusa]|uniref:Uncharacterized protein n=1 Tax=Caerostris extrusa TaxID=172846 RepID=A0AAV4XSZ1_CAEEX|nr:hypothetical protein CEXT_563631 [Caerostris extrusa]
MRDVPRVVRKHSTTPWDRRPSLKRHPAPQLAESQRNTFTSMLKNSTASDLQKLSTHFKLGNLLENRHLLANLDNLPNSIVEISCYFHYLSTDWDIWKYKLRN